MGTETLWSGIFGGFGILGLLVAISVGKIAWEMAEGLDLPTHNQGDEERRAQEELRRQAAQQVIHTTGTVTDAQPAPRRTAPTQTAAQRQAKAKPVASIPLTGDAVADNVITKGQEMLVAIREANDAIPDARLSYQMDELEKRCTQVLMTVSENPGKAPQVRKFMNYYLPTTLKLLINFRAMQDRGISENDLYQARATTIQGLEMILTACQKQLDNLYRDNMLDMNTDIDVLEKMLKRDGYLPGEMNTAAATAAAQAMRDPDMPVLTVPDAEDYFGRTLDSMQQMEM